MPGDARRQRFNHQYSERLSLGPSEQVNGCGIILSGPREQGDLDPMFGLRKRPSDGELESVLLVTAMLARTNEHDQSRLSTSDEIGRFLRMACKKVGVRPDDEQKKIALHGVQ
ncbi:MAG: hypothetical protein ACLFWF_12670, partial [Alphaproteobacteria bacterium]